MPAIEGAPELGTHERCVGDHDETGKVIFAQANWDHITGHDDMN